MNKAVEFLNSCGTFYVATQDGNQPRVRPFGAIAEINGRVYITTNNTKNVFKQIQANPRIEICGCAPDGNWIRISAEAVIDPNREVKAKMLKLYPVLESMYSLDDGIFEVMYLKNAIATLYFINSSTETFSF